MAVEEEGQGEERRERDWLRTELPGEGVGMPDESLQKAAFSTPCTDAQSKGRTF